MAGPAHPVTAGSFNSVAVLAPPTVSRGTVTTPPCTNKANGPATNDAARESTEWSLPATPSTKDRSRTCDVTHAYETGGEDELTRLAAGAGFRGVDHLAFAHAAGGNHDLLADAHVFGHGDAETIAGLVLFEEISDRCARRRA